MHCDFCLRESDTPGCCHRCFGYLVVPAALANPYLRRLWDIALVQKEIRLAGGIKPWIAAQRKAHAARFPKTDEFIKSSDLDVRSFTERLRLVGGPLGVRP
jgi:hypothetical protein